MTLTTKQLAAQELQAFYENRKNIKERHRRECNQPKTHPGRMSSYRTYIREEHIKFLMTLCIPISSSVNEDQICINLAPESASMLAYIDRTQTWYLHRCENENQTIDPIYTIVSELLVEAKECMADPYIRIDEMCVDDCTNAAEKSVSIAGDDTLVQKQIIGEQPLTGASLR